MSTHRRALVTGGAGFIGGRLALDLVSRGWQVWILDNFSLGQRDDGEAIAGDGVHGILDGDVADVRAVSAAVSVARPMVVFHLASVHFIPQCERDPIRALETNVVGTQVVLTAIEKQAGCRMVFASTGDVYAPSAEPHHEQSVLAPMSLYGITKLTGEQLVQCAGARGLDYRIARLFNVFGPGDRTPHVLPDIVNGLSRGDVLALGRLDAVRDYVYVDDVVQALVALGEHEGPERIFNVGTGEGRSVQELVDAVLGVRGIPAAVRTDPAKVRAIERASLVSDSRLARSVLGWAPRTTFREGIERLVATAGRIST